MVWVNQQMGIEWIQKESYLEVDENCINNQKWYIENKYITRIDADSLNNQ